MKNALLSLTLIVAQHLLAVAPVYVCQQADGSTVVHLGLHGCPPQSPSRLLHKCCCSHNNQAQANPSPTKKTQLDFCSAGSHGEHARLWAEQVARIESSTCRTNQGQSGLVLFAATLTESHQNLSGSWLHRRQSAWAIRSDSLLAELGTVVLRC